MRVFIAEKPSLGMDIARAIGPNISRANGYVEVDGNVVTWCIGHILEQAPPEAYDAKYAQWAVEHLPIIPDEWKVEAVPKTKEQLNTIGFLLKKASSVVHCGDAAREGQLIVDEVLEHFRYRGPVKRLWLQETNPTAVRAAIRAVRDNQEYRNLQACALARSRADWLMGMNLTCGYTAAWRSKGARDTLHLGRVQTPTLSFVVARELEIEVFQPKDFFVLRAAFTHPNGTFQAAWQPPNDAPFLDDAGRVLDRTVVDAVAKRINGKDGLITHCETKPKTQAPPLPFSLGDLQKAANKLLGLSPSDTLKIAQALYEKHKLTSYPRTDYSHLPEGEHGLSERIIDAVKSNFGQAWDFQGTPDFTIKTAAWDSSKIGDHHGLRPTTTKNYELGQLSKNELAVYRLIVRNFLAQFYPPYRYNSTVVEVFCEGETFKTSGAVETAPGWKVLFRSVVPDKKEKEEDNQPLPQMASGDTCRVTEAKVEAKKTTAPPRFDGASLIDAMEKAYLYVTDPKIKPFLKETGLGTQATRAPTIDNLVDRGYMELVKEGKRKVYVPTAKGRLLYKIIPDQLRKPDLTAYFEELLKAIERGELSFDAFMNQQTKYVVKLVNDLKSGAITANMPSLADCTPPPRATTKQRASKGKAASSEQGHRHRPNEPDARACPKCTAPMRQRTSAKGPFWGCSGFPACKHTEPLDVTKDKPAPT